MVSVAGGILLAFTVLGFLGIAVAFGVPYLRAMIQLYKEDKHAYRR